MSRYHHETVVSAVNHFAFPEVNLDNYNFLPYQEPPFRHVPPGQVLVDTNDDDVFKTRIYISKKPEGSREIFVGLYDNAEQIFHMYSMNRFKAITYIAGNRNVSIPTVLPESVDVKRRESVRDRARTAPQGTINVMFVMDVCRVVNVENRTIRNVVLSELGPMTLSGLSETERQFFLKTYDLVFKHVRNYSNESDIDEIINLPEEYPYNPENGVVLVQGYYPGPRTPCAKYTPPEFASVYLHVLPIITMKTRLWKLFVFHSGNLEPYKVIPAPANFYVPPIGAVVSFKIEKGEHESNENYWRFVPKHIRQDKSTPSTMQTVHRFITRFLKANKQQKKNEYEHENILHELDYKRV